MKKEEQTKPEEPVQEPQMNEPTHKLPESLPYKMMIGDLRRCLFTRGDSAWNGYIRDMTAELEEEGEYVNVAEAFSRINAKAAKMMGALEFQKAMGVPATPAPSQPVGAREFNEYMGAELFRAQRDWLIAECARVGVTVNVIIGAPLEKAYRLDNAAERERDSLRELLAEAIEEARAHRADNYHVTSAEVVDGWETALKAGKDGQQ